MATKKKTTKVCEVKLPEGSRTKLGEHGTTTRYNQMKRLGAEACQDCKTANTQRDLAYRAKQKSQTGTKRHLKAVAQTAPEAKATKPKAAKKRKAKAAKK